jgi:hypothetical protein
MTIFAHSKTINENDDSKNTNEHDRRVSADRESDAGWRQTEFEGYYTW